MKGLILLVVAAAWAGVLLPPLLRSRLESRPGSSVTSFRRQLTNLQRSVPGTGMAPMRQMARPLAGAPRRPVQRTHADAYAAMHRSSVGQLDRRMLQDPYAAPRQMQRGQQAMRSSVKQRRQNILVMLALVTAASGFLCMVTTAMTVRYVFALGACLLVGYVYLLSQKRRVDQVRNANEYWHRAA